MNLQPSAPKVELISPAEMESFLSRFRGQKDTPTIEGMGFRFEGFIDAVCREESSQEVAWELHQRNLFTDYGRREWMNASIASFQVGTSPSAETPLLARYSLSDNGQTSSSQSTSVSPTNNSSTNTKTFSTSFGTPSGNRQIGTIGLGIYNNLFGFDQVVAYSLITPIKTQTTTQTLEIVYRITITPVA